MNRTIIFYENHFIEFYQKQDIKVKGKIQNVFELKNRVSEKFLKHVTGTDGLSEIRIEYQSNIYRVFCCFDDGQLVVLFNGFQKKTPKTSQKEIDKAERLMKDYFENKNNDYGKV